MAKSESVAPAPFVRRPFLTWDKWFRNILDDISELPTHDSRLRRALELKDELLEQHDLCQITDHHVDLGCVLIDAILRGWYGRSVGVRCVGVSDCDEDCPHHEHCARFEIWARMYDGTGYRDARIRTCAFLAIHVPQFTEKLAKRLGIYDKDAF